MSRRIKSLEAQVSDIRQSQVAIQHSLADLVHTLRSGVVPSLPQGSFPPFRQSPGAYAAGSPSLSTPTSATPIMVDAAHVLHSGGSHASDASGSSFTAGQNVLPPMISPSQSRQTSRPSTSGPYRSPPIGPGVGPRPPSDMHPPQLPPPNGSYSNHSSLLYPPGPHGPTLPPISSFPEIGRQAPSNVSSMRYHSGDGSLTSPRQHATRPPSTLHTSPGHRSPKRKAAGSSNVTSSNTSDLEDDDNGELPSKGLVAPWEVLRGLADVAAERAALVRF